MQKYFPIFIGLLLSACTTDPVPDEEFEAPTLNFPLLGNVPDRPSLPSPKTLKRQQNRLKSDHNLAFEKQKDILNSLK